MTLVVALAGVDGIVLAGDRRTAIEEEGRRVVADTSRKIFPVAEHVGVGLCGQGDLGVYLLEKLLREVRAKHVDGITSVFEISRRFLIAAYDEATQGIQPESRPPVGFIFAGLDHDVEGTYSQPRICSMYQWEGFQPLASTTGWDACGPVWIAEYLISGFYAPSMTVEQLARLASLLIVETASQDSRVGGEPLLAVITASGYREILPVHCRLSYSGATQRQAKSAPRRRRPRRGGRRAAAGRRAVALHGSAIEGSRHAKKAERLVNGPLCGSEAVSLKRPAAGPLSGDGHKEGPPANGQRRAAGSRGREAMAKKTTIGAVHIERFLQSGVCIASGEKVVYVDPHRVRQAARADLILITHDHFDHLDLLSIRAVEKANTVILASAGCIGQLEGKVRSRVIGIEEGQTVSENGIGVRAVPGYSRMHPRGSNVGFLITLGGQTIYHAGDTGHIPEMACLGSIDVALLPIDGIYTMSEQEAAEAVKVIQPKVVIPIHYGYGTSGDPQKFASLVGAAARVVILDEL